VQGNARACLPDLPASAADNFSVQIMWMGWSSANGAAAAQRGWAAASAETACDKPMPAPELARVERKSRREKGVCAIMGKIVGRTENFNCTDGWGMVEWLYGLMAKWLDGYMAEWFCLRPQRFPTIVQ
jgi:hypothetical protein